jgi:hypothetical protein
VAPALGFFKTGRATYGEFESGIQYGLMAIVSSPKVPLPGRTRSQSSGSRKQLQDQQFELASRLSFFLWSQIPDETLVDLATKGA